MQFLYPGFLFALAAIAVPILIHLFHFRRFRKVYFSSTAFLQQLSDESKRQSRLRHLLILLARILAIVFLVLAFARPFIPPPDADISAQGNKVGVYIDNSFSMEALAAQGRLIDLAREKALEIAGAYQPSDRFLLLTNDFEGRHQRFVSRDEFTELVARVRVSPRRRPLHELMQRMQSLMADEPAGQPVIYYLSDFQKSSTQPEALEPDSLITHFFLPLEAQRNDNVYIDSCWFASPVMLPGQAVELLARLRNDGSQPLRDQPLRLMINGVQRSMASYDLEAGGETEVSLSWTLSETGIQQGLLEIVDYPVSFDDQLFFSYRVNEQIRILGVDASGSNPFLRAMYRTDPVFSFESVPEFSLDYSRLTSYSLVVLNELRSFSEGMIMEILRYVQQGGHLLILPATDADLVSYNQLLGQLSGASFTGLDTTATRMHEINEQHPVFEGVFSHIPEQIDLPGVSRHFVIRSALESPFLPLLSMENGHVFLGVENSPVGRVYVSSVGLNDAFSTFQRHAIFVPVMANIALHAQPRQPAYHLLGSPNPLQLSDQRTATDEIFILRAEDTEIIPEQRSLGGRLQLFVHDQLSSAGNYRLYNQDMAVKGVSFNYDRRESAMETWTAAALTSALKDAGNEKIRILETTGMSVGQALERYSLGRQFWRLFLILALLMLLAEGLLIRFWK